MRAAHLAAIAALGMISGLEVDDRPGPYAPRPVRKPQTPSAPTSNRKAALLEKSMRRASRQKNQPHD